MRYILMEEKKIDLVLNKEVDLKEESDMLQYMVETHVCQFQMGRISLNYIFVLVFCRVSTVWWRLIHFLQKIANLRID